jgi:ParB family transcriptional regulator, chromosome partitioning protein
MNGDYRRLMNDDDRIYELDIEIIEPNPLQPRGLITPESLAELAESIRQHGILEPLVVARTPAGYQIVAGERRWRASKLVGLKRVPVVIKETDPKGMLEMAIVENVQRVDLNPLERAQAYKRLMDEFQMGNTEISERVSKSPSYISNTIRLLTLPDAIKDAIMSGATTEGHARALSGLEDPHLIIEGYKEVLKRNLSVRGTEELVRRMRQRNNVGPRKQAVVEQMRVISEDIDAIENNLSGLLSGFAKTKVKCVQTGQRAKLEVSIDGHPAITGSLLKDINEAISGYFRLKEPESRPQIRDLD